MGCNCGGGGAPNVPAGGSSGAYMLIQADGTKKFFSTESAARAANAKSGGTGLVKRNN